ncbi:CAP domain-containing protein [Mastigocladus laminosus UU774]|nr:CAP domain-containing protein [Mastigocladus laminosus UU774]
MIRQSAFGTALSMLVLAGGLTTTSLGHTSTKNLFANQTLLNPSPQIASVATFKTTDLEKLVFERINGYRASLGLKKLTLNANISKQARIHSQNMARGKVPFSHQGFEQRVNAIPIRYISAAENVAYNLGYSDPAAEAITGWIKSPEHLVNIKGNYNLTGIGVATNNKGEVYLTQIFIGNR